MLGLLLLHENEWSPITKQTALEAKIKTLLVLFFDGGADNSIAIIRSSRFSFGAKRIHTTYTRSLEKNTKFTKIYIPLPRILLWSVTAIKLQRKAQPETLEGNITFETIVHHILWQWNGVLLFPTICLSYDTNSKVSLCTINATRKSRFTLLLWNLPQVEKAN